MCADAPILNLISGFIPRAWVPELWKRRAHS